MCQKTFMYDYKDTLFKKTNMEKNLVQPDT